MSDRADEIAQEFVPENATKIMVDTRSGDRQVYSADEWREQIVAALRAFAEEARRKDQAIVEIATRISADLEGGKLVLARDAAELAAALRARGEGKG